MGESIDITDPSLEERTFTELETSSLETNPLALEEKKKDEEDIKFGKGHPFLTVFKLSVGPFLYETAQAFQDSIDLFLVKKAYHNNEAMVGIISMAATLRTLIVALTSFLPQSLPFKISQLIAKKNNQAAAQILVDYIRIMVIIAILLPVIMHFAIKPILSILNCPRSMATYVEQYIAPVTYIAFILGTYKCYGQVLIGIAKSTLGAVLELSALVISLFVADPIAMFGFHASPSILGICYFSGQMVMFIVLTICFFLGKFKVRPTFKMFISKPSSELWSAIKPAIPILVQLCLGILGPMVIVASLNKAAMNVSEEFSEIVATVVTTASKLTILLTVMTQGSMFGLRSSGSWAFSRKKFIRLKKLAIYSLIFPYVILVILVPFLIAKPEWIMRIWLSNDKYHDAIKGIVPKEFYGTLLEPLNSLIFILLIILGYPMWSIIIFAGRSAVQVGFSILLYQHYPNNPYNIAYIYPIFMVAELIVAALVIIYPWRKQLSHGKDETTEAASLTISLLNES